MSLSQLVGVLQSLSFTTPAVLLALVAAFGLVLFAARERLRMAAPRLQVAIMLVRCLLMALLILALAGPTLRPTGHARAVVFALDVSDSMSPEQQSWARDWVARAERALPPGSQAQVVEFGQRAQVETDATRPPGLSTDIASGLRLAATLLPRDTRRAPEVVLISDGWQTTDLDQALSENLPTGVAVSYLEPPHLGSAAEVVVHSLDVPPLARTGDQVEVGVTLQAAVPVDVQLRVTFGSTVAADGPLHLEPGETRINVPQQVGAPGFVDVRAELAPAGGTSASSLSSVMVAKPAGRILVLEDEPGQGRPLASLLQAQGLEVQVRAPGTLPPNAAGLSNFDAVVMVNTPATALTLDQQRTLQSYVQDLGRGLTVVGGARTFAPGGYQGTVLDDMLPVSAEPPIEPQQGSLALFLVIDRSGSMDILSGGPGQGSGATKLAMAREAAIQAANLLQPDDTLGVIAFDSAFQWVVEPTRLRDQADVAHARALIGSIRPGGGTSILAPLTAAFEAAAASDAPLKHVVLLTDGESNDRGYEDLIQRMKPSQITLSTLAIGSDADTKLLSSLARLGGGRYYFTERTAQIPRIASKETTILTRNAVVDGRVGAVVGDPSPIVRSLPGDFPTLSGYVATTRKERAVTALESERGHPLLAHWQYGLGRVVAWTSEAQQGWTSEWTQWPSAGQFWAQAVRWSMPAPVASDFVPSVRVGADGRQVALSVQALGEGGHFADLQDTRATVVGPDGQAREVILAQRGPGAYGLETRADVPGVYRVLFRQGARQELAAFSLPDAVEAHVAGVNRALLEQIARSTGGREVHDVGDVAFIGNGPEPPVELWPWLLGLAILLLPLDVYLRRRA